MNVEGESAMKARRIMGDGLIVLAVAFTAYICAVMTSRVRAVVLKDTYAEVFRYELFACACFILFALDVRFGLLTAMRPRALNVVGWVVRALVVVAVAVMLFLMGRVAVGSLMRSPASAANAIVLGLALENGKPTDDLISRLDTAEAFLRDNPGATLILTGGNPGEDGRTEAAVMRDILAERGVAEERMRLEDRAETTTENFLNVARMVDPGDPIVLISSGYHMDRAVRIARRAGFSNVLRLPAPSSVMAFGANVMWEAIMELNEMTLRR